MVIGDLIHVAAAQFSDPGVTIAFDSDALAVPCSRAPEHRRQVMAVGAGELLDPAPLKSVCGGGGRQSIPRASMRPEPLDSLS
jgi:hypothetical protein